MDLTPRPITLSDMAREVRLSAQGLESTLERGRKKYPVEQVARDMQVIATRHAAADLLDRLDRESKGKAA